MRNTGGIPVYSPVKLLPHGLWQWFVFFFIVGVMTLSNLSGLSKIMMLYGLAMSSLFLIYFLYHRLTLQPEIIIYFAWVVWSVIGLSNAVDRELYVGGLRTIVQMAVMILVVSGIMVQQKNMSVTMLAMIVGGMIVAFLTLYTGEFQQAADVEGKTRAAGITENANSFAYLLLFVIIGVFFFWERKSSSKWRMFLLLIMGVAFIGVTLSASRKGFFGVLVFIFLWWAFCKKKKLSRNPIKAYIVVVLLLGGLYFVAEHIISSTVLGKRFELAEIEHGSESRIQMYKDGLEMIRNNPLIGVGLDNYRALSTSGLYSHSDYVEVAANTGIIGFILYFSIYVVLWRRLKRIKERINDAEILYTIGLLKAAIMTILILGFGRPNISSKLTWIFLASTIGYSWSIDNGLRQLQSYYRETFNRRE